MELVIAAAVLALGLVAAATLYGRGRLATANGGHADAPAVDAGRREAAAAQGVALGFAGWREGGADLLEVDHQRPRHRRDSAVDWRRRRPHPG